MRTLRRLKEETAGAHLAAESHVRILDADATVDDYLDYLDGMRGIHEPVEAMFAVHQGLLRAGFAPATRRKVPMLERDLRALGGSPREPMRCDVPAGGSLSRALGIAYVIEGSTLGGRFILAKLPASLQPLVGHATSFLEGYRSETGPRWRAFAAIVEREITTVAEEDAAVAAAIEMFTSLTHHLERVTRPFALGRAS